MTDRAALWQQLQQAELVAGELPIEPDNQQPAFFLRILLGASAWLSALFFCVFIATFFISVFSVTRNIWIIGVILYGLSLWISRIAKIPLFVQQAVMACSLAGQALIVYGLLESNVNSQLSAVVILILEILLFALTGIRGQRAGAIFIACAALLWLLGQHAWLYALPVLSAATAWLWLNRLRWQQQAAYLQPATSGLTLALCLTIFVTLLANSSELSWLRISSSDWHTQLSTAAALSSVVCLVLAWQLIQQRVQQPKLRSIAAFVSVGIALVNLKMPGLAPLCLLLCIGVAHAYTRLIWLNLCCLVVYLLLYYYSLNETLLYKSLLLCVSGAVLLILYSLLIRVTGNLTVEHSDHA